MRRRETVSNIVGVPGNGSSDKTYLITTDFETKSMFAIELSSGREVCRLRTGVMTSFGMMALTAAVITV